MLPQHHYYERALRAIGERDETFMEIMQGSNPLTATEIRKLAAKRPERYSRYLRFAERMEQQE